MIAADEARIEEATSELRQFGGEVIPVKTDLAREDGVGRLVETIRATNRPVEALLANAGRGLGQGFLDQDWGEARRVVDTNVTGTLCLVHQVGREMRARGAGRILITGSIAGFMPGTFQAVYNGTKAFLDSFAYALRHELQGSGVTVTCLMPGGTDTEFFERANMTDTKIGTSEKDDPAFVAREGFAAMIKGSSGIVTGWRHKLQSGAAHLLPADVTAEQHRRKAAPGSGAPGRPANGGGGSVRVAAGLFLGGLAAATAATLYGLGRPRTAPWAPPERQFGHRPVLRQDLSGWGRAG